MKHGRYKIYQGDVLEVLRQLPERSVHCVATSPPYWGQRDYGTATWKGGEEECDHIKQTPVQQDTTSTLDVPAGGGPRRIGDNNTTVVGKQVFKSVCQKCGARRIDDQIGLEPTPDEYVAKLVEVFRAVWRVLRDDGTLWLNLGDSYNAQTGKGFPGTGQVRLDEASRNTKKPRPPGLKPKDLCGMPWRVVLALQADGWYLRSDIIWAKPNPMPESCMDRPTKAHEYLFLLTKKPRYFYDTEAIKEPASIGSPNRQFGATDPTGTKRQDIGNTWTDDGTKNKRSVWAIPSQSYPEAHFATYPTALVEPCIAAGTSERGCCPECGKPWVRVVERQRFGKAPSATAYDDTMQGRPLSRFRQAYRAAGLEGPPSPTTIGWRPGCKCYGLPIIEEQSTEPKQQKDESDNDFAARLDVWKDKMRDWRRRWKVLKPRYEKCNKRPCTVLDPFMGSGTTLQVAVWKGRNAIGIELNPKYIELARRRIRQPLEGKQKKVYNSKVKGFDFGDINTIKET